MMDIISYRTWRQIVRIGLLYWVLWVPLSNVYGQSDIPVQWKGWLSVSGEQPDTFALQLQLTIVDDLITGFSESRNASGKEGRFTIVGQRDGQNLLLQEVEQLSPAGERWCLKYLTLRLEGAVLTGTWKASSCPSGNIRLEPVQLWIPPAAPVPFSPVGSWTGRLSQSDREYGFYYALELHADGTGVSTIVSEENGGRAWHDLRWVFHAADSTLEIEEWQVQRKTDAAWKWCIKKATYRLGQTALVYSMEGPWSGYIEGYTPRTGRCASGTMYLERPLPALENQTKYLVQQQGDSLRIAGRPIRVQRSIEVANPNLYIRIWDNGTVDGDVVSVFLNGRRIAHRLRVQSTKASVRVQLNQDFNLLVLFAEDIGSIAPNTVAISIYDGVREQVIVMHADMEENGGVVVRQFKAPK